MSTIASPRDPGAPFPPRRMPSSSSVNRPSLDIPADSRQRQRSRSPNIPAPGSPSLSATTTNPTNPGRPARNRAALREYYKLPKGAAPSTATGTPTSPSPSPSPLPAVEITDPLGLHQLQQNSEIPASELDAPDFLAATYVGRSLASHSLESLLRAYARVVGETRALDAEKKALVYDNYSKLISATETIRKMRSTMDPLNPMASTLDPAIAQIYVQASAIRDALRERLPVPVPVPQEAGVVPVPVPVPVNPSAATTTADEGAEAEIKAVEARRKRTKQLALAALEAPDKVRALVAAGRADEARRAWEMPRRLLVLWKERGLGGDVDVDACIADGDTALRGGQQNGDGDGDGD